MTSGGCSELYSPLRFTISCFMQKKSTWRIHWEGCTQSHFLSMKEEEFKHVRNKLTCYFFRGFGSCVYQYPKSEGNPFPSLEIFVGFCNS